MQKWVRVKERMRETREKERNRDGQRREGGGRVKEQEIESAREIENKGLKD